MEDQEKVNIEMQDDEQINQETVVQAEETTQVEAASELDQSVVEGINHEVVPKVEAMEEKPFVAPATSEKHEAEEKTAITVSSKKSKKTLLTVVAAVVACAVIAVLVVYFTVIKPNGIYEDAVAALDRGDFQECERLMNEISNHKDVPALRVDLDIAMAESYIDDGNLDMADSLLVKLTGNEKAKALRADIQYLRAVDHVSRGEFDEAKRILNKLPDYDDTEQLYEQIDYAAAIAALDLGDYETAYSMFSKLEDYQDAAEQKEIVYYEALAFKSLFNVQETLKNPASLRVTKVTFYSRKSDEGELDAVYEITATNSYGGSLGAYAYDLRLYDGIDDSDMISHSDYVDPDDYLELLQQMLVDAIMEQPVFETKVDVARMNRLLESNASFKIDLPFESGAVVEN